MIHKASGMSLVPVFFLAFSGFAEGLLVHPPSLYGFHPLYEDARIVSPLNEKHPVVFDIEPSLFKDTTIIDFEKRQVTCIQYDLFSGLVMWQYHYEEMDEYINSMRRFAVSALWLENKSKNEEEDKQKRRSPSLEFSMPVSYPAWARRVLGKEPPKLSIKGFQSLTVSFKRKKVETGMNDQDQERPTGGFGFDYDNMFTIAGSVGRLINIEIKTGKDKGGEDFSLKDQMKKLKIEYRADPDSADQLEDEVIQEVIAGYTNFQMPGQGLAGYSGSHEGLFGVKIRSQWGPLSLTTIVSRENSETQKTKIDPTGKSGGQVTISETDIVRYAYYFLDSLFLDKYTGKTKTNVEVIDVKIYQLAQNPPAQFNNQDYTWAFYDDGYSRNENATIFKKFKEYTDYELDKKAGWIRFLGTSRPGSNDIIAIILRTSDGRIKGNDSLVRVEKNEFALKDLWILKNIDNTTNNPADSLMWRNVYALPQDAQPDNFKIEVNWITTDKKKERYKNQDSLFSYILGITDKEGNADIGNEKIFDFSEKYIIMPPRKWYDAAANDTIYSNQPFWNLALKKATADNRNPTVYDDSSIQYSIYEISTTGSTQQTSFQIGWGIMPGSEKLTTSQGKVLERDKDYFIDYEFGSVTLLSDAAKSASEIEVDYQQESLFQFESKRFMGAYGKLDLPNIGRESYFATSIMGQFTSTKEKIPRVGSEPFNRLLFDANLRLDFEPEWMTTLVNFIPLLSSTSTSSATMDFEFAYSYLKPEQENSGEAYIDNFQSSEKGYPLGENHASWYQASPWEEWSKDSTSFLYTPPAWRSYWYSPVSKTEQTSRGEIWTLTKDDREEQNYYMTSLRLVCQPAPANNNFLKYICTDSIADQAANETIYKNIAVEPWAGIMQPIPTSLQDRRKDRYLEFYVKNKEKTGVLYVDLGVISEDLSLDGGVPNGVLNREKWQVIAGEKDSKYDRGLDTLFDSSEVFKFPDIRTQSWRRFDSAAIVLHDEKDFAKDPGRDNWARYDTYDRQNKIYTNGTQGDNGELTSEDINNDALFNKREAFFRIAIDFSTLDSSHLLDSAKVNDSTQLNGWFPVRIPINSPKDSALYAKYGNPQWDNIRCVRLLWTKFGSDVVKKKENVLEFTEMRFTGNQWEEQPDDSGDVTMTVAVLNNIDDKGYYAMPAGIDKKDNEGRLIKDYALRLNYTDMRPGQEAIATREIPSYQTIDLTAYDQIRMYIKEKSSQHYIYSNGVKTSIADFPEMQLPENRIQFIFRFGNSDSSYYEYRTTSLDGHWKRGSGVMVDLRKLAALKQRIHEKYGNALDSINVSDTTENGDMVKVYSNTSQLPTFSNIRWMALGVARHQGAVGYATGEIWVNGIRVKGVKTIEGCAFRANLNTKWADFMDFSANVSYDDADFKQMSDEPLKNEEAALSAGINAQWLISKFLPEKLGITIPIGTAVSASMSRPKQRPGTDIMLTGNDGAPDRLGDMGKDFLDLLFNSDLSKIRTSAEHYQTNSVLKSWYTSYSKTVDSDNPFVNFTADRITTNYNYSRDSSTQLEGLIPETERKGLERQNVGADHINVLSSRKHGAGLKYDLTPRKPPEWTSWKPFAKAKAEWFSHFIKEYTFNLLPSRINFDLVNGQFSRTYKYRSLEDITTTGSVERTVENLNLTHAMQLSYSPIAPIIEAEYDIALSRNFDDVLARWGHYGSGKFINDQILALDPVWKNYYITNKETSRSQNASLRVDPQFFEWLTHTADYRVRYNQNPRTYENDPNYLTLKTFTEFNLSSNFRFRALLTAISERLEKLKGLSAIFDKMGTKLDKISLTAITFSYAASSDLINDYVSTSFLLREHIHFTDFMLYQLGLKDRSLKDIFTASMDDKKDFGGVFLRTDSTAAGYDPELYRNDRRTVSQNYSVSTSMQLPKPIEVTIRPISLGWNRTYSVVPNPMIMDTTVVFPDFNIGANSSVLEKIPLVKQNLRSLGLRSTYKFTKTTKKSYTDPSNPASLIRRDITRGHAWEPLVSVNGVLKKWPVNLDYNFGFSFDSSVTTNGSEMMDGAGNKNTNFSNTWNVNYTVVGKPDREIMILNRWTVPIKGETVMGMDVTKKTTKRSYFRQIEGAVEETNWSFQLHPKITYDFTDNIDGLLEYIFEKAFTGLDETTRTNNTFALTVTIHFN